jgi:hypothetical protein
MALLVGRIGGTLGRGAWTHGAPVSIFAASGSNLSFRVGIEGRSHICRREEGAFSDAQREGLKGRKADQDRTLTAIHRLEEALASAAPGRETAWRDDVLAALAVLEEVAADEDDNAGRPDSLLSDIKRAQPRLRNRVRGVRLQYGQLRDRIAGLRRELGDGGDQAADFADIRQRVAWLLTAFRHQRARESDLIYEAYYDAFNAELRPDT